jgi:small subunit ribosomal protein S5
MSDEQKIQPTPAENPAQTQEERATAALAAFNAKVGAAGGNNSRPGDSRGRGGFGAGKGGRGGAGGGRSRDGKPFVKKKEEFNEQTLDMRRVARVMAGGKRFSFRATLVIGDNRGRVGVGVGKGIDVQQALVKAKRDAQKNMITVPLAKRTIPHEVEAKFSAARIRLKPAKEGNGLIAGGAVRAVLTLAGIKDITSKVLGRTPNKLTNAMATVEALKQLKQRKTKVEKKEVANV